MTGKRSRLEMYLDVLQKINSGINRPTNVMYKCNLSWIPMQQILKSLIQKGLICEVRRENKKVYAITERGQDLLRYLENVLEVLATQRRRDMPIPYAREKPMLLPRLRLRRNTLTLSRNERPSGTDD